MATEVNNRIETVVFLDLETTGLPGSKPKIIELAMVAVERSQLLSALPCDGVRVLNKMTLLVNPRKPVDFIASQMTGLDENLLSFHPSFDQQMCDMIKGFLDRLPQPVCLVAHNGNNFDFRLLNTELKSVNYCMLSDYLCVDSLTALRYLHANGELVSPGSPLAALVKKKILKIGMKRSMSDSVSLLNHSVVIADGVEESGFVPVKKSKLNITSFNLEKLYRFFFKSSPNNSHNAEGDCLSLLKICHLNCNGFLPYIDKNATKLSTLRHMY